ncbi:uncharacterized protein DNG_07295 [Cephalotrichum gorgonifer]|uniref:Uncharacterized protein n=1 Tax=Cephalotrichum gorgonifer TaxID=2041049 RepID=A0AAE8N1H7_9PEZI|nr:uncharacterized protein DNG_07295 [Cephalotrichum gorgonifer]
MFPVSVAISQAQWTWFRKERPLHDFHLIDQASRSPWGSIVLLWKVRVFHHPVALGALLTIFGVLTSPITQLVITYPVRSVVDPSVQVNALSIRSIRTPRDAIADGTRNALLLGPLTDATNFTLPQEPLSGASCSTGNCTFGSYHTLGVCMKTANITAHLAIAEFADNGERGGMPLDGDPTGTYLIPSAKVYTASLPGGFDLTHQGPMAALVDILNGGDTFGFSAEDEIDVDALGARIASFVNIYTIPLAANETGGEGNVPGQRERVLSSISSFRHEALEVLFYLCVQTYETSIVNGVEKNQLVGQLAKRIEDQAATTEIPFLDVNCTSLVHDQNTRCEPKPSRQQEVLHLQAPGKDGAREEKGSGISVREQEEFSADYHSMERMASAMKLYLASSASVAYDLELFPNARAFGYGASSFSLTLFSDVLYRLDSPTAENSLRQTRIMNIYLNIATSLSTMMRVGMPQRYTQDVVGVAGLAWREIPYVHVTWGLLTFLAAELVLTAILIAITAVRTYDGTVGTKPGDESRSLPPDLKDSSLPVLSALNPECRALMGEGIQPIEELKARSRKIRVRLEGGELVPVD